MISVNEGDRSLYMTAQEAAEALGVSRTTLYAYVSRRGIRSLPVDGTRERLYWRSDIEGARRARGRPKRESGKVAAIRSGVSLQTDEKLFYRGYDAIELSEKATLEEVAAILWNQPQSAIFGNRVPNFSEPVRRVMQAMNGADGIPRAIAALPLLENANPRSFDFSPLGLAISGADVVRSLVALMMGSGEPSSAPIHDQIGDMEGLTPEWRDFARRLLVLAADHTFEASTNAVRSVASVGVSPYRSVTAGLLMIGGRRTQTGRFDTNARLIAEICEGDPEEAIMYRVRTGTPVPGFGYGTYRSGDPRARALLGQLDIVMGGSDALTRFKRALAMGEELLGLSPDFALVTQFAGRHMARDSRASLFVIGRSVGWIAHSIEQMAIGEPMRPASVYIGPLPRE